MIEITLFLALAFILLASIVYNVKLRQQQQEAQDKQDAQKAYDTYASAMNIYNDHKKNNPPHTFDPNQFITKDNEEMIMNDCWAQNAPMYISTKDLKPGHYDYGPLTGWTPTARQVKESADYNTGLTAAMPNPIIVKDKVIDPSDYMKNAIKAHQANENG